MFSAPFKRSEARRRGINSVETGIAVLQAVVDLGGPASLKDIAERSGLVPSQAHRYVSALVNCGMLAQSTSGRYDLGYSTLRAGLAAVARLPALEAAFAAASELTQSTGATSLVAVWSVQGPTIVRWNAGRPPVYTALTIGSVLPVRYSATGGVYLAFGQAALLEPALKAEGLKGPLAKNAEVQNRRSAIRKAWLASVDGTAIPGLRAFAAPILGCDDQIVAVVTTVIPDATSRDRDDVIKRELRQRCIDVSRRLGAQALPGKE